MQYHVRLRRHRRKGSVLVEFALIALVLYFLLAATLDMGRALYSAQVLQQAADHIARELSHTPLAPDLHFQDALASQTVKQSIYSSDFLAIDITNWINSRRSETLLEFLDAMNPPLPSGNKLLVPLMIRMDSTQNELIPNGKVLLVYPGALVPSGTARSGFFVQIPVVVYGPNGTEQIAPKMLDVVEPIQPDMFPLTSTQRGVVGLRVNFPFQAAAFSGSTAPPDGQPGGTPFIPVPAGEVLKPGQQGGPYSGPMGLGQQAAFARTVRPFRKILTAQAIYRREIFRAMKTQGVLP